MKRVIAALALVAILLVTWVVPVSAYGYNNQTTLWGTSFFYKIGQGTVTAQLIAGKTGQVGTVTVWENEGILNVQYDVLDEWNLTETALFVGRGRNTDKAESLIPGNRFGNYNPDKFGNITEHDPSVLTFTYALDESDLGKGSWLCVAAYAELVDDDDDTAKAWGDLLPVGVWKLPKIVTEQIIMGYPGSNNHSFDIQLSNIRGKYSISNGVYNGWCVDGEKDILIGEPGTEQGIYDNVAVYSSLNMFYAWNIPTYIKSLDWNRINYILNHHNPETSWVDIQAAILYFANDFDLTDFPDAQALVDDALENGKYFVPGAGQIGAVILDAGEDIQPLIIEINAPTGCFKEWSCRYDCTPNWSPCQDNWEPVKWNKYNWNPCWTTHNTCNTNYNFHWNFDWTPVQNFNHFGGCK